MHGKATPRPWRLGARGKRGYKQFISSEQWDRFATVYVRMKRDAVDDPEGLANAALIVRAVNAHDNVLQCLFNLRMLRAGLVGAVPSDVIERLGECIELLGKAEE